MTIPAKKAAKRKNPGEKRIVKSLRAECATGNIGSVYGVIVYIFLSYLKTDGKTVISSRRNKDFINGCKRRCEMKVQSKYIALMITALVFAGARIALADEGNMAAAACSPGDTIAQIQTALNADPGNEALIVSLAKAYESANWYGKSLPLWEEYLSKFPNGENAEMAMEHAAMNHRWIGTNQFITGQPVSGAEIHLMRAITLDPKLLEAYIWLGRAYLAEGRYDGAASSFLTASDLAPDNADVIALANDGLRSMELDGFAREAIDRAITLYDEGHVASALSVFRVAEKEAPQSEVVHYWLGRIYSERGQFAKAVPEFTTLAKSDPNSYRLEFYLSDAQLLNGEAEQQLALYQRPDTSYEMFAKATPGINSVVVATANSAAKLNPSANMPVLACVPK